MGNVYGSAKIKTRFETQKKTPKRAIGYATGDGGDLIIYRPKMKEDRRNEIPLNAKKMGTHSTESDIGVKDTGTKYMEDRILSCKTIDKRALGKAIIKFCGNEGVTEDSGCVRSLLQAVITFVSEDQTTEWSNAEVQVYDKDFQMYKVSAGKGRTKVIASIDIHGQPQVVRQKESRFLWKYL